MKILSIAGRNLNSLKQEFRVDFSTGVLKDCGIFAITGPTGAGKTTLLDAMMLALYGRTPRSATDEDIISYGAGEAWAEVIFETPEGCFKSEWKVRKARTRHDGTVQQSTMELSTHPDKDILSHKKREAQDKVKSLIKLDYDQFLKSVLLAQGAFKAFLDAKESERGDMLEKISDTSLYTRLSKKAFERKKQEEQSLKLLQDRAGNLVLLTEEDRALLSGQISGLQLQEKAVQEELEEQLKLLNWLEKIRELTQQHESAGLDIAAAKNGLELEQANLMRWEAHKQVAPLEPEWKQYLSKRDEGSTQKKKMEALKEKISGLLQQIAPAENLVAGAAAQVAVAVSDREEKIPLITRAIQRKQDLQDEILRLSSIERQHLEKVNLEKTSRKLLSEHEKLLATDRQLLSELESWVGKHPLYGEADEHHSQASLLVNDLKRNMADKLTHEKLMETLSAQITNGIRLEQEAEKLGYEAVSEQQAITLAQEETWLQLGRLKSSLQNQTDLIARDLEAGNRITEKLKDELSRQQFLADHLSRLHEGEPCALCGSKEHPNQVLSIREVQEKIRQIEKDVKRNHDIIAPKTLELKKMEKLLASLDDDLQPSTPVENTLPENFTEWGAELVQKHRLYPQKLQQALQSAISAQDLQQRLSLNIKTLEATKAETMQKFQDCTMLVSSQAQSLREIAGRFELSFDEKNPMAMTSTLKAFSTEFQEKCKQEAVLKGTIPQLASSIRSGNEQLNTLKKDIGRLLEDIEAKKTQVTNYREEIRNAHVGYASPEEAKEKLEMQEQLANEKFKKIAEQSNEIRQQYGKALGEKQTADENLLELATAVRALSGNLTIALKELGLNDSLATIEHHLLSAGERATLEKLHRSLHDKLKQATDRLQHLLEQLQLHQSLHLTVETTEELNSKTQKLRTLQQEMNQQLGQLKQILKEDNDKLLKIQSIKAEIENQKDVLQKWATLSDLIGSENGKKFNQFAQGLTLDRLLAISNHHLKLLSDRYLLKRNTNEQGLGLLIIDKYQADNEREINTLSGGESFLASLALALGLSEMTSKLTTIDSLFIDEGFGTLDSDTLEVALGAMRSLQLGGKTIGIISHVERLKEEIYTQVEIRKGADGFSTLKVIPEYL